MAESSIPSLILFNNLTTFILIYGLLCDDGVVEQDERGVQLDYRQQWWREFETNDSTLGVAQ